MDTAWSPEFKLDNVDVLETKSMYSGYCSVLRYHLRFPLFEGGMSPPIYRECLLRPPAVSVVLYDPLTDQLVMIEQIRTGALNDPQGPWLLEIVAGMIDEGESPEETAHRETREEANCKILSLLPICKYLVSPGISNEATHVFCGLIQAPAHGTSHGIMEDGEDIKLHVIPALQVFDLLKNGKITSACAVIGLQWLQLNREHLRSRL